LPRETLQLSAKELTTKTWPDFERLFEKPGEWGACWCIYYQRARPLPRSATSGLSPDQRAARNREDKKGLVKEGRSHGIIVYNDKEPIGWCQYGPREELPRIDAGRKYRGLKLPEERKLWRITCFCVDRRYRNRDVASFGLEAALKSIRESGGGTVEAYPVTHRGALAAWFGTVSMFMEQGFEVVAAFGKSNVLVRRKV